MPAETRRWTVAEVRELQDESRAWPRYELIAGELLVTPAPTWDHQRLVGQLFLRLHPWTSGQGIGETLMSPADLELEPEGLVQPDVFVVPPSLGGSVPRAWTDVTSLMLAVEVLSPSTARDDRGRKRELFSRIRVPEYWIVDPKHRVIERWRPGDQLPELCTRTLEWGPPGATEPLVIDVPEFFRTALGE
jgi:Uma2 family endonuclease